MGFIHFPMSTTVRQKKPVSSTIQDHNKKPSMYSLENDTGIRCIFTYLEMFAVLTLRRAKRSHLKASEM